MFVVREPIYLFTQGQCTYQELGTFLLGSPSQNIELVCRLPNTKKVASKIDVVSF